MTKDELLEALLVERFAPVQGKVIRDDPQVTRRRRSELAEAARESDMRVKKHRRRRT